MKIQHATTENLDNIATLSREVWYANFTEFLSKAQIDYMLSRSYTKETMQRDIEYNHATYIKGTLDRRMIGYAAYRPITKSESLLLDKIYVHPSHQHQGYGYQLYHHIKKEAIHDGFSKIKLYVSQFNTAAVNAYAVWGFEITDTKEENIGGKFEIQDYIMVKDLKSDTSKIP